MWALELEDIDYSYATIPVLSKVSLRVAEHTIHGLLGPNGAGKTTLLKIATGLLPLQEGKVRILGHDLRRELSTIKNLVGLLPEIPPLYLQETVGSYLALVARLHGKKLFPLKAADQDLLDRLGLSRLLKRLIGHLSKGQQQKVGLAQALIYRPPLLILDEPWVGLDPSALMDIRQLLEELKKEHTIFLSSHQLHDLELIASAATIIGGGKILASGTMEQMKDKFKEHKVLEVVVRQWAPEHLAALTNLLAAQVTVMAAPDTALAATVLHLQGPQINQQQDQVAQYCLQNHLGLVRLQE
ncbi:MAG: ABC transporter ATP-binding protein, partial [Bacteriovoracaceae bacterium]|nr:ABC transporter ATP-binding protein [Bacteriovoracaceae bacterium]